MNDIATIAAHLTSTSDRSDMFVGMADATEVAKEWLGLDVEGWVDAGVFDAGIARKLEAAAVTPEEVAALDASDFDDVHPGYGVANGDIRVAALVRAIEAAR